MRDPEKPQPEGDSQITTVLARKAVAGDQAALGELVARFTPPLVALARARLGCHLQGLYDPLDLVGDAWVRALPRLPDLQSRAGRLTPVVMRFLSRTLINRYNSLLQKHVLGKPLKVQADRDPVAGLDANTTAAISGLIRDERHEALDRAIQRLDPRDREVVLLRGIEQVSNAEAALILAVEPAALSARFNRALAKLSELLPDSIMPELPAT